MNTMKAWLLMGALTILMVTMGGAFGGQSGALIFFLIAMGMNFFGYFYSDKMAIKMTGSYPITEAEAPELYAMVRKLTQRARMPMPKLYIQPSDQPNAFATGPSKNNSMVAVSTGLLNNLKETEVKAVLAHEMGHVFNGDMFTTTVLAGLMNTFVYYISNFVYHLIGSSQGREEEGQTQSVAHGRLEEESPGD